MHQPISIPQISACHHSLITERVPHICHYQLKLLVKYCWLVHVNPYVEKFISTFEFIVLILSSPKLSSAFIIDINPSALSRPTIALIYPTSLVSNHHTLIPILLSITSIYLLSLTGNVITTISR